MTRYRMHFEAFDNSAVNTRQVRRQRERLSAKGRSDVAPPSMAFSSSAYKPHNGKREMARRVEQMRLKAADVTRHSAARWLARHAPHAA